jgi:hypothetical protein
MSTQSKQPTLFKGGIVVTMDKEAPNLPKGDGRRQVTARMPPSLEACRRQKPISLT